MNDLIAAAAAEIQRALDDSDGSEPACPACLDAGRAGHPADQDDQGAVWYRALRSLPPREYDVPGAPQTLCWDCRLILRAASGLPV